MAYVAPQNKLAGLSAALSGTAKGMADFQKVQMQQNQMAEQKRQFDENLAFGFKRLDEQIRQFDQSDATTRELQQLSRELQERQAGLDRDLTREEGAAQRATALRQTGMQVAQRDRELEQRRQIDERNFRAKSSLSLLDQLGYANLGAQPGIVEGETPEQHAQKIAKWNQGARTLAIDAANANNTTGNPITEDDIALELRAIHNAPELRKEFARQQYVSANAQAQARGLSGGGSSLDMTASAPIIYSGKTRHQKAADGTMGPNVRIPEQNWLSSWSNATKHRGAQYNDPRMGESAKNLSAYVSNVRNLASQQSVEAESAMAYLNKVTRDPANFPGLTERDINSVKTALQNELTALEFLKAGPNTYVDMDTLDLSREGMAQQAQQQAQQSDRQAQVQQMMDEGMTAAQANRSIIDQANSAQGNQVPVQRMTSEPTLEAIQQQNPSLDIMEAVDVLREKDKQWDKQQREEDLEQYRQDTVGYRDDFVEGWFR